MSKKILFVITQSEIGGAQRFLSAFAKYLKDRNYEIVIATSSGGQHHLERQVGSLGIPIRYLSNLVREPNFIKDTLAIFQIRSLIKEYEPDTLFLLSSKAGFIGSLATMFPSKIDNLNVIYRIGGWTFNDPWPNWKKRLWQKLEKISAAWKDVIVVNNIYDLEQAKEFQIIPRKILKLIHNGIDTYNIEFLGRDDARQKLSEIIETKTGNKKEVKNLIGTIANLYPAKGIEHFIKSAAYFSDGSETTFIVIGEGDERKHLEEIIKTEGLSERVFLVGSLGDASKYLSAFDVFVLPSLKEGFPWALIEAMAARLAVIATPVGAVPQIVEDGKNGFIVERAEPGQIARRAKEIMNNDRLKTELGIQAHQTVLLKFSESKMLKETESLL